MMSVFSAPVVTILTLLLLLLSTTPRLAESKTHHHIRPRFHSNVTHHDLTSNRTPAIPVRRPVRSHSTSPAGRPLQIAAILPDMTRPQKSDWRFSLQKVLPAIELALERVRRRGLLVDVQMHYADSACHIAEAINEAFNMYQNDHLDVIFGPCCDYAAAPVARQARFWNVPMITAGAMASEYRDYKAEFYPLLTRVGANFNSMASFFVRMLQTFHWNKIKMLYDSFGQSDTVDQLCHMAITGIYASLRNNHRDIAQRHFKFNNRLDDILPLLTTEVANEFSIVVLCANADSVREIMITAAQNHFDNGDYVFFNIDLFSSKSQLEQPWFRANDTAERNSFARRGFQALKTITLRKPDSKEYKNFSDEVKRQAGPHVYGDEEVNSFVGAFHDAVILYALAVNETLSAGLDPRNGTEITRRMWNRSFQGITGNVTIDDNGDRNADYSLLDMDPVTGRFEVVANYFGSRQAYEQFKAIHWAGNRTSPPSDTPLCGFDNAKCQPFPIYGIVLVVFGSLMLVGVIIALVLYRKEKLRKELAKINVKWVDIKPISNNKGEVEYDTRQSIHHRPSLMNLDLVTVDAQLDAIVERQQQLFTNTGIYKMRTVAIKTIPYVHWNHKLAMQCKKMKDLQHDHITRFIGICTDRPSILTEYCSRGSLMDVLDDEKLKLDDSFRLSLIQDIVMGMIYLHNSDIRSHGNLKSSNCVVDSRFVLKITDFGLHRLRFTDSCHRNFCQDEYHEYSEYYAKLWTAPDLLQSENYPLQGTQKGDVYSFAVICHEILMKKGPFWRINAGCDPEEIYWLLRDGQPIRPTLIDESSNDSFTNKLNVLIRRCWEEIPENRPDFHAVKAQLRKIRPFGQPELNLMDNLLKRMEQYANNLESLVEARTIDFLKQKKKAEDLLFEMMPRSVVYELQETGKVAPVRYKQVTIYFSDIVGFTSISNQSEPEEVCKMLHKLYNMFDEVILKYGVYKVETIGDAYMVVSGLPELNGNLHAREIAQMALALLRNVQSFVIDHLPDVPLKLRIGLHSGEVVACVVGKKMPRYCLFGDTVNTASRMESTGKELQIHVSPTTRDLLCSYNKPKFILQAREDLVCPKGLPPMQTYWLRGDDESTASASSTPADLVSPSESEQLLSPTSDVTDATSSPDCSQSPNHSGAASSESELKSPAYCNGFANSDCSALPC